jgi:hypothetical protein
MSEAAQAEALLSYKDCNAIGEGRVSKQVPNFKQDELTFVCILRQLRYVM